MLKNITIKNFKAFRKASLGLSNINVFAGLNGMGKSSFIQVLLLLRQTYLVNKRFENDLILQRDLINIGLGADAMSKYRTDNKLEFEIIWKNENSLSCLVEYTPEIANLNILPAKFHYKLQGEDTALFNNRFEYLNALRITPDLRYDFSTYDIEKLDSLGVNGQYTVHYLSKYGSKDIRLKGIIHPQTQNNDFTLLGQLDLWMSYISPGLKVSPEADENTELSNVSFSFEMQQGRTDEFKSRNVGFGITYVLPVVTAILKAKSGDLIIIENPESHIHPRGQVWLGELFALAGENGVQLIIETHSDHILNGIRYAAKQEKVKAEKVKLFFFDRDINSEEHITIIKEPRMNQKGKIDNWHEGFFDTWDDIVYKLI